MEMSQTRFKTGLVLSGGGARGFAHLGVIKALNEAGIYPEVISGTSAGAIVGVLYADGYSPDDIMKMLNASTPFHYMRFTMPRMGLLQISGIVRILKENLRAKTFEELKLPMFVSATNLNTGQIEYFSSGELLQPVIASASIPVLFKPVVINDHFYVDGGVLDNLPVKPVEDICDFVIGSFVNPTGFEENITSLLHVAERTFLLNVSKEVLEKSKCFDLFVDPPELRNYKILDPEKAEEVFMIGYDATIKALTGIEKEDLNRIVSEDR
jgi:NTE family protein